MNDSIILNEKKESRVVSRIVDELTNYSLDRNTSKLEVTVENLEDQFTMNFKVFDIDYTDDEIEKMSKSPKTLRDWSVEAYYWTLLPNPLKKINLIYSELW